MISKSITPYIIQLHHLLPYPTASIIDCSGSLFTSFSQTFTLSFYTSNQACIIHVNGFHEDHHFCMVSELQGVILAVSDPLYLAPGDISGLNLVSSPFNGKHYLQWSRAVKMALISKNKLGFITGKYPKPAETAATYQDWIRVDYNVMCWILHSLIPEISGSLLYVQSSKQLWDEIKERYSQANAPFLYQLRKDVMYTIQENNQSVADYFGKLKSVWEDLQSLDGLPDCECGALSKCSCSLLKKVLERDNRHRLIDFLMGLDKKYETVRSQILASDPLPTVNQAFFRIQQIEMQKSISNSDKGKAPMNEEMALAANKSYYPKHNHQKYPNDGAVGSNSQKQTGHNSNGYKKEYAAANYNSGYKKPAYNSGGANNGYNQKVESDDDYNKRPKMTCTYCNRDGHTVTRCYQLHGFPGQRNNRGFAGGQKYAANVEGDTPLEEEDHSDDEEIQVNPAMMKAIFKQLVKAVKSGDVPEFHAKGSQSQSSHSVNFAGISLATTVVNAIVENETADCYSWIFDSGASDHMTYDQNLFQSIRSLVNPIKITLPDGTVKLVKTVGDVVLNEELVLRNVLYLPEFKHHLMSVGRLLHDTGLQATFTDTGCILQDPTTKRKVCVGQKLAGVFRIRFTKNKANCGKSCFSSIASHTACAASPSFHKADVHLAHSRLGHVSLSKLLHVPMYSAINKTQNFHCDTCIMSKHHKLPFPVSHSLATTPFALIHVDLWGPYRIKSITGASYFFTIVDDHTRVTWTSLLKDKTEVAQTIVHFLAYVHTRFGPKSKSLEVTMEYIASLNVFVMGVYEPSSYAQAKDDPNWQEAMNKELQALEDNHTWILTTLPPGKKAIGAKWVYKVNVRTLIAIAAIKGWHLHQLDINNAFLHGFLDEEVYMEVPQGYSKHQPHQVCLLKRSLYGLKQASRQWNLELTKFLKQQGFEQSTEDYSLFLKNGKQGEFMAVLVYVDDLLITGNDESGISHLKTLLDQAFTIKDLGFLRYFLGIEVSRSQSGILLNQRKYISDILTDTQMINCKTVPFPFPRGIKLSIDEGDLLSNPEDYRRLVGRLLYLNLTRPDISYSVQQLSQFLSAPRLPHMQTLHLVKYLKHTLHYGLFYSSMHTVLTSYCDG
ncbi:uncharacterized protein LOC141620932 [Silene latifolia]|uniref:uncharacterized protein LOC141620932 n=1 Tax=Silene latifolia TaxID=37657 RepID=UPI003D775513